MLCDICGKENACIRHVTRSYGKGMDLLIIENIPAVTCRSCGETYLTADTLHEIRRIKLHRKNFAVNRNIPVAAFACQPGATGRGATATQLQPGGATGVGPS